MRKRQSAARRSFNEATTGTRLQRSCVPREAAPAKQVSQASYLNPLALTYPDTRLLKPTLFILSFLTFLTNLLQYVLL